MLELLIILLKRITWGESLAQHQGSSSVGLRRKEMFTCAEGQRPVRGQKRRNTEVDYSGGEGRAGAGGRRTEMYGYSEGSEVGGCQRRTTGAFSEKHCIEHAAL